MNREERLAQSVVLIFLLAPYSCGLKAADAEMTTLGPWRIEDTAYSATNADDRPNKESEELKGKYYSALVTERVFKGMKGELSFRVAPRCADWAGILILNKEGKPVPAAENLQVTFTDPEGKPVTGKVWKLFDTRALFSDASPVILPKTRITVTKGKDLVDEAIVDFSQWTFTDSRVRMSDLLDGPTARHGFVTVKDGRFIRDGKPIFFWGGHENHIVAKSYSDVYAEIYAENGLNLQRSIAFEEMVANPATGEINKEQLDKYHYLIAKLGEKGIYFLISGSGWGYLDGIYGIERGKEPPELKKHGQQSTHFWINQESRKAWKNALRTALTAPNPYKGGKAIKDDPTIIGFELSNETGLNERRFDFNRLDATESSSEWRTEFNKFLLKKYGNRDNLAKAWEKHPLFPHEDPAKNNVLLPSNYRGARTTYGGTGQHDAFATPRWYLNGRQYGLPARYNPRVTDAIEFNAKVAKKAYPFDFNNLGTSEETAQLRQQFNAFLLQKYVDRVKLADAWAEDLLFPWEDPAKNTILIPTFYRGQDKYEEDTASRLTDPRVGDAMEFTCQAQKDWATDMAKFLREEIGLKCAIGWNGDTFHVVQPPNHVANMESPLDLAIAAAYLDWDNGDQLTSRVKNLKRFTAYGRILGRPMVAYEWSFWNNQGPHAYEYCLLAALLGRTHGFDAYAHHKMEPIKYPVSDPIYSLPGHNYIHPLSDRPRRGVFQVSQWIMQRSRIEEEDQRLIIGFPRNDAFVGGPERKMSNWAFENWLMYQIGVEDFAFQDTYDGPTDRVVIHCGHGPYGDYRKARHAALWCHSNSDREGKDPKAKEKWFALHGIKFEPGQKYFLNDQFFATTEDLTDYNLVHSKAEQARWGLLRANEEKAKKTAKDKKLPLLTTADDHYWAAEPDAAPSELDRQLYQALKKWGYPLPFEENEIDRVWRSRDRTMVMDTAKVEFRADRADLQLWFGKLAGKDGRIALSKLEARSNEKQYSVALLPWDTGDFQTAKSLVVWSHWNSEVTVKLPLPENPEIYAVNWLGKRLYRVKPISASKERVTFAAIRDDDLFCYEVLR
ncbi:MAG: hypothetical protein HY360_16095 [Verrucomicrobia bacterium]|nr:hypothetical protein [Verrucomicrobiota bacterium]